MVKRIFFGSLVAFIALFAIGISIEAKPVNSSVLRKKAIHGYDAVAYFKQGKPVKGRREFVHQWKGAKWYFSNKTHLAIFQSNPSKYAPQYGGFCAYAVSKGHTADIDPDAWDIYKGKLYLNYDSSIQKKWARNKTANIKKGNGHWPRLRK